MKKIFCFLTFLAAMLCITSCSSGSDDDNSNTGGGDDTPSTPMTYEDSLANIATYAFIQQHTEGNGFPIVIMADGFSKAEITSGKYESALEKAKDNLFCVEPMKSLEKYFDVIGVTVPSNVSGITAKKQDTALRTYYESNTVVVHGDSAAIETLTTNALMRVLNLSKNQAAMKYYNTLVMVLPNTDAFKGVTYFSVLLNSNSDIPEGTSISYIPAYAKRNGADITDYLAQHEAVGHGIAKLADEYVDKPLATATQSEVDEYAKLWTMGAFRNTSYKAMRATTAILDIEETSWLYPFTQRSEYADEDIKWYRGAYTYPRDFYRSSDFSIMNTTVPLAQTSFNVASRAMIYKCVMRVAYGSSYTWNLDEFITFDAAYRESASTASAKAAGYYITNDDTDALPLATPRVTIVQGPEK